MRFVFLTCCLFLSTLPARSQLLINEYLSSNVNGIQDQDQDFSDWIEIYNNDSLPLDITGYSLTDDMLQPAKWTFPSVTLPAYKHILVFASDKNRKEIPMSFETIIDVGDEWNYLVPDSDIGLSWQNAGYDDSAWTKAKSSFGYADNDDTTIIASTAVSVFIRREFNLASLDDISRLILCIDYDDGFVAYINGHEVARANLGNPGEYMAYDRLATAGREALMYQGGSPEYYEISDPLSVLVEGVNTIAIQVHNNAVSSTDLSLIPFLTIGRLTEGLDDISSCLAFSDLGGLHTNFKLDADSDRVFLYNDLGILVDSTPLVKMTSEVSYGRKPDGGINWSFFGEPTPGTANITNGTGQVFADTVFFFPEGGMHPADTPIELSSANTSDTIYYTLDGSIPDAGDLRYTGPVVLDTSIVVRARVIRYDALPGAVSTRTYVTGLNHDIPIVCLSTEPRNLWDEMSGIYAFGPNPPGDYPYFGANFWKDWERPVHMELYDVDGIERIDQDAGMKIFGAWSRASDQKSVSLFARKTYGKGSFKYQFFADKPIEKFESIILRNSGNDNMGLQFHDCFMTGLTREMNIDRQAYQPAAIYLNGQYWGLLNIREKVSNNYVAENYHVDADSVNLLEWNGSVIDGSNETYYRLTDFVNAKTTLQNSADFNWVQQRMDIDNFIQYQLTEIYLNNRDWPGNNIKYWNTTFPLSKWRWIIYDTDFGFGIWDVNDYMLNTLEFALEPNGPDWPNPPWATLLLRRLVTNQGFRNNFIIQYCDRLNRDLSPGRALADLDSLRDPVR